MTTTDQPVDLTTFGQATKRPDGTDTRGITVHGEPTAVPELFITAHRNHEGFYTGHFALTHLHTGLAVRRDEPYMLRDIAERCIGLDWSFTDADAIPDATKAGAGAAIRAAAATEPTADEQTHHPAWRGKGDGLARSALGLAAQQLENLQWAYDRTTWGHPDYVESTIPDPDKPGDTKPNPEWHHLIARQVEAYGLAFLLLALHRVDTQLADSAAASLADAWDAGDSLGEWAYEWTDKLTKGQPVTLPGLPDADTEGDLASGAVR